MTATYVWVAVWIFTMGTTTMHDDEKMAPFLSSDACQAYVRTVNLPNQDRLRVVCVQRRVR